MNSQQTPATGAESSGSNDNGNNNNNTGNNQENSNSGRSNNNNNRRNNDNRRSNYGGNERTWEGDKPEVKAVLGLRTEWLDKKVSYRVFLEKMIEYVLREIDNPKDVLPVLKTQEDPLPKFEAANMPAELSDEDKKSEVKKSIQSHEIKLFVQRKQELISNMQKIYGLVKGQCSASLRAVLKTESDYEEKDGEQDVLWLLENLKKLTSGLDSKGNKRCNLFDALLAFITMRQGDTESDTSYMKRFRVNTDTLIAAGGQHIFCSPELMDAVDKDNPTEKEKQIEEDKFKAIVFLKRSDQGRYGNFLTELQNSAHLNRDEYPESETAALDLMVRRSGAFDTSLIGGRGSRVQRSTRRPGRGRGYNFSQSSGGRNHNERAPAGTVLVAGTDGRTCNVLCYRCQTWGHYAGNCPEASSGTSGTALVQCGVGLSQGPTGIPRHWLLLDSCSTDNVFNNCSMLGDIISCSDDECLNLISNGGTVDYELRSTMKMFPLDVHYNENSIANVMSLYHLVQVKDLVITMDNRKDYGFHVTYAGKKYHFLPYSTGLYYWDTLREPITVDTNTNDNVSPYSLLQSVEDNKKFYTSSEIKGAENARRQQEELGWPSDTFYKSIISQNLVNNSEVTIDDVERAIHIFGPAKPVLQGTMTRMKPTNNKIEKVPLPLPITQHHSSVSISIDFFYVNGHTFLTSKSSKLNFTTVKYHKTRSMKGIIETLNDIRQLYSTRGFHIDNIHGDNEFNKEEIKKSQLPALFHIYGKEEHVGLIERSNRTVKEKARTMTHATPYVKIPKVMVIGLITGAVRWINAFPHKDGVSTTMSPATIVQGLPKPNMKYKRITYGAHAMVFMGSSNKLNARSVPAVAMNASNEHGGHYFMSLYSGKRIHSYEWKELPIDEDVISRVEELAEEEEAPEMKRGYPIFTWKQRMIDAPDLNINDAVEDALEVPLHIENIGAQGAEPIVEDNEEQNDDLNQGANDELDEHVIIDNDAEENNELLEFNEEEEQNNETNYITDEGDTDIEIEQEDMNTSTDNNENENDDPIMQSIPEETNVTETEEEIIVEDVIDENAEEDGIEVELNASGRPRRQCAGQGVERLEMSMDNNKEYASVRDNKHQFVMQSDEHPLIRGDKSFMSVAANYLFAQVTEHAQMSAKAGIKKFGDRAVAAMLSEYKQLNTGAMPGKPVFGCIDPTTLTYEEKRRALEAVNLIKKKRCGKIKGRTCANGSKQKRYLKHGETISSPTVSLEAIIGTLLIDANEGRDVAIFDVPGAYLQAEMPAEKKLLMIFRDEFVDIMCEVNPEYRQYVIEEKGKKVLYVRVLRAIYGCIESALLWYQLYVKTLKGMGFKLNPYDKCVANKMINGKQCTIAWYVDDNKLSHADPRVVTEILDAVKEHFGELVISRGNKHDLLGMKIEIDRKNKNVIIDMRDQIKEAFDTFGEDLDDTVSTPANKNLFTTYDGESPGLNEEKSEVFHSVVAKLLFIMKRGKPDIETTISYLMTRVSKSNEKDWEKLKRCLGFLKRTFDDLRHIGADSLRDLHVWVDASHAIHANMRGHTGGTMSMGTGTLHNKSSKQKLNTKSTTESEVVGVSEYLPYDIWQVNFFKHQGYDIRNNYIYQDNESAIKMERNGRNSCTGNSRHIDIKYFWVKDRVDKKEVEIKYCPTTLMLADYFTKPLQGNVFRRFRSVIMGYTHINDLLLDPDFLLKERVEKTKNIVIKKPNPILNRHVTYADAVRGI